MGNFRLPELKGRENQIYVDGKTLNQIAKECGLRLDTVQHRYSRGDRTYTALTRPTAKEKHKAEVRAKKEREINRIPNAGERLMEIVWEKDTNLQEMARITGVSRSTIYSFLYDGRDISSYKLSKLCAYLGVSMDYIMGLRRER